MSAVNLTPREMELLCAVVDVMKADINWNDVAPKANYTTAKQARDKWTNVRAKLAAGVGGGKKKESSENGAADTTSNGSAKKAAPKKRKAASESTPAKGKKAKKSAAAVAEDEEVIKPEADDGEGDEES